MDELIMGLAALESFTSDDLSLLEGDGDEDDTNAEENRAIFGDDPDAESIDDLSTDEGESSVFGEDAVAEDLTDFGMFL